MRAVLVPIPFIDIIYSYLHAAPHQHAFSPVFSAIAGPPGMNPMNPRMNPPRGPGMAPMAPGGYGPGMRAPPPNANLGPGSGPPMGPMGGPGGPRQWQPVTSAVSL
jgi:hypothetical protein